MESKELRAIIEASTSRRYGFDTETVMALFREYMEYDTTMVSRFARDIVEVVTEIQGELEISGIVEDMLPTEFAQAHFYLGSNGYEITRAEFLRDNARQYGVMLYFGGGFVPLQIAVIAIEDREKSHKLYVPKHLNIDLSSVVSVAEEFLRNNGRGEEIGEDEDYFSALALAQASSESGETDVDWPDAEYELHIEILPARSETKDN